MTDADRIAHEAARLLHDGTAPTIRAALVAAAASLGLNGGRLPSPGRVRRHLQAMEQQTLGDAGYRAAVHATLEGIEELMTALEQMGTDVMPLLVGRAAAGRFDGPGRVHVRVYTTLSVTDIAETLVDFGYEEPRFETADTRLGRLDRLVLPEPDQEFVITRCLPAMRASEQRDLFTDEPIDTMTLSDVRSSLDAERQE